MKLNCTHVLNIEVQSLFCSLYLPFNGKPLGIYNYENFINRSCNR